MVNTSCQSFLGYFQKKHQYCAFRDPFCLSLGATPRKACPWSRLSWPMAMAMLHPCKDVSNPKNLIFICLCCCSHVDFYGFCHIWFWHWCIQVEPKIKSVCGCIVSGNFSILSIIKKGKTQALEEAQARYEEEKGEEKQVLSLRPIFEILLKFQELFEQWKHRLVYAKVKNCAQRQNEAKEIKEMKRRRSDHKRL